MSKNKTADSAERKASKMLGYGGRGKKIAVYQFPAGHWDWCTTDSEIYRNLSESDHIYPGVKASQWEHRYL
jgi:hypothetical protein